MNSLYCCCFNTCGLVLHSLEVCSIWKELDCSFWCRIRWYVIPEETAAGRQAHNLRRELYRTNDFADIEVVHDTSF